ncbi:MAG: hypothetical protein HY367_04430 [Candidatus Aenigmarchaeota archaeon]|nr:hypothetical protein [Candidatus Aenigmarchaeota archaeon]
MHNVIITPFIGLISASIIYLIYRNGGPAAWAFIAAMLIDSPKILILFGVENIDTLLFYSHTTGIFLFPILLVAIDILLIELSLVKFLKPFKNFSKTLRELLMLEDAIERLQKYHAIPRPIRVARLYLVAVITGVVHLVLNFIIGSL